MRFDCSPQPEFDRCRWVDYWRPVKEVVYFKRPVYVRALHELAPLAFPERRPAAAADVVAAPLATRVRASQLRPA